VVAQKKILITSQISSIASREQEKVHFTASCCSETQITADKSEAAVKNTDVTISQLYK